MYSYLWSVDFQQEGQNHSMGKGESTINGAWNNWISVSKRKNMDTYTKINSKWVKNKKANVRAKTIKFLEGSVGVRLCDSVLSYGFLNITPKADATKGNRE